MHWHGRQLEVAAALVAMKVPISDRQLIDLDAPVLPAYRTRYGGIDRYAVWCKHCREWHFHGPAEGHREAHCSAPASPYHRTGYNLAYRSDASRAQLRRFQDEATE